MGTICCTNNTKHPSEIGWLNSVELPISRPLLKETEEPNTLLLLNNFKGKNNSSKNLIKDMKST